MANRFPDFRPTCDVNGLYQPQQCWNEVCWCVSPITGEMIPNSVQSGPAQCIEALSAGEKNKNTQCSMNVIVLNTVKLTHIVNCIYTQNHNKHSGVILCLIMKAKWRVHIYVIIYGT